MICTPQVPCTLVRYWMSRHEGALSFTLHMVGIPPTIMGVLLMPAYLALRSWPIFWLASGLFVGGFLVQFLGHALEGTDPGEVIMVKRRLGMRYVEVAPRRPGRGLVALFGRERGRSSGPVGA